jgi:hypothetical protein
MGTIRRVGVSCCRDFALPVGFLRKTDREERQISSDAVERYLACEADGRNRQLSREQSQIVR